MPFISRFTAIISLPLLLITCAAIVLPGLLAPKDSDQLAAVGHPPSEGTGIYLIDLDRGFVQRLQDGINPTWTNDGSQLTFLDIGYNQSTISLMNLPHTQPILLSGDARPRSSAIWTADGREVLWTTGAANPLAQAQSLWRKDMQTDTLTEWLTFPGSIGTFSLSADGRGALITGRTQDLPVPTYYLYIDGWDETQQLDHIIWADWSPISTQMVVGVLGADAVSMDLFLVDVDSEDGLQLETATRLTDSPNQRETYPVWSPDGTRIAYLTGTGVKDALLVTHLTANTTREYALPAGHVISNPQWSPDGKRLLFDIFLRDNSMGYMWLRLSDGHYHIEGTGIRLFDFAWRPPN